MNRSIIFSTWISLMFLSSFAQTGSLTVTQVMQRTDGTGNVDIYYNLQGPPGCYSITADVSFNDGTSFVPIPVNYLLGNLITPPGNDLHIVWNGKGSSNNTYSTQSKIKLTALPFTNTVTVGTGTTTQGWPYYTYFMDSRTQMLYTASEITSGGGTPGSITAIGFNVSTRASQAMNGFQIKMKNTTATSLSSGWQTGLTTVYSGTYAVPGTGWQMITLHTPFNWDGSNLVIEICYDNNSYTSNSTVYCTSVSNMTQHTHFDGSTTSGCNSTNTGIQSYRPNLRLVTGCATVGAAAFTIGAGYNCSSTQVSGVYIPAVPLTSSNTVSLQANVTTPGDYSISTNVVNGFSFSKNGRFTNTGIQTVILTGSGTPLTSTTTIFTVSGSNSAGSCTFTVTAATPQYGVPCPGIPTINYGGQVYNTVQIGTQCWMAQNLNIGTKINGSQGQTNNSTIEKYCFNDLGSNCDIYGGLYQWDEAMQYVTTVGVQGICPAGWHLPTDAEWTTLSTFLGGESVAGGKMKETGTTHWLSPNTGATNTSGFTALPGGARGYTGSFGDLGLFAFLWSSTEYSSTGAWNRYLDFFSASVSRNTYNKTFGFSVRCARDAGGFTTTPTVTTTPATNVTQTAALSGGNVTSDGGAAVTARGVCWSVSPNPTISGTHTSDGSGTGTFTSTISGLNPNTSYYIRAYATNSVGTAYGNQVTCTTLSVSFGEPCPGIPTINYGGQVYNTVQIGSLCWLKENLNVGTRINGSQSQTNNSTIEKYCYNDQESNCDTYGGLYQWNEAMQYVTTAGVQGICPAGWHLPTDAEWTTLTTFLGGESVAGGKMKETGTTHWLSPNTGATNTSGFTALPGGTRIYNGYFYDLGDYAYFWSSTEYSSPNAWYRYLRYDYANVGRHYVHDKTHGFSVRCARDAGGFTTTPTVTTTPATNVTQTAALSGGNVTSDGGAAVTARGVCWSVSPNPTISGTHTSDGSGTGTFTSTISGLISNTTYYIRAYATNSIGTAYGNQATCTTLSVSLCPGIPTINYGGQVYNTVQIGSLCWLKENLNVGTRINGSQSQTNNSTIEKYCYNDQESNCDTYGGLYQWNEAMQYVTTAGVQGICPAGWHLPTDAEWTTLTTFLGGESVAGGKMKETGTTHWLSPNTGATNTSGFTALPGGLLSSNGSFDSLGDYAYFWSTTEYSSTIVWYRYLISYYANVFRNGYGYKTDGFSVRCARD